MGQVPYGREVMQSLPPLPPRFHPWLAIAVAHQKAAQARDPAHRCAQVRRPGARHGAPDVNCCQRRPFVLVQRHRAWLLQPHPRRVGQPYQPPRDHAPGRQRTLQLCDAKPACTSYTGFNS